jgi:hypothetical protein
MNSETTMTLTNCDPISDIDPRHAERVVSIALRQVVIRRQRLAVLRNVAPIMRRPTA